MPGLTTERLAQLMRGDLHGDTVGGWLGDYGKGLRAGKLVERIYYLDSLRWLGISLPKDEAELQQKQSEKGGLERDWHGAIEAIGPQLWELFAGELDQALSKNGVKRGERIIWLPAGALGLLPLGLAQDPASKRRLTDTYEIVYSPNLSALTAANNAVAPSAPASLTVIGDAQSTLSGAAIEEALVAAHFPAKLVVELDRANPQSVLAALPQGCGQKVMFN